MEVKCPRCRNHIQLGHHIFKTYRGPVKCFSCGTMAEIETAEGVLRNACELRMDPIEASENEPLEPLKAKEIW